MCVYNLTWHEPTVKNQPLLPVSLSKKVKILETRQQRTKKIFLGSEFWPRLLTLVKYAGKIKGRLEGVCWRAVHVSVFRRNQLKMDWKVKDKHDQRRGRRR